MQAIDQETGQAAPRKKRAPSLSVFTPDTEQRLQLYFARAGQLDAANASPSNFGAMCERADRMIHASSVCRKCWGSCCSRLSPEELVERARTIETEKAMWAQKREAAETGRERLEADAWVIERQRELEQLLLESDFCKACNGTGVTKPRRIARGKGDNVQTSFRCSDCAGAGQTNYPDPWDIRRTLRELELHNLSADQIVEVARCLSEQFTGPGRWRRVLEFMRRVSHEGLPDLTGAPAELLVMTTTDTADAFRKLRALMVDQCRRCHGAGYIVPITVRETGSSVEHGAKQPNVSLVREHGQIDRIFWFLALTDQKAAVILETYYGPTGNRWGHSKYRREFALYPLTKPGAQLAREAALQFERDHNVKIEPHDVLAREIEEDQNSALINVRRRDMLMQADKSSRTLLDRAKKAWTEAVIALEGNVYDEESELAAEMSESESYTALEDANFQRGEDERVASRDSSLGSDRASARAGFADRFSGKTPE